MVVYKQIADVRLESLRLKQNWMNFQHLLALTHPGPKNDKFVTSCQALRVEVPPFFAYRLSIIPAVLDACRENTITLLLGL